MPGDDGQRRKMKMSGFKLGLQKKVEVKVWTAVLLRNMLLVIGLKKTEEV